MSPLRTTCNYCGEVTHVAPTEIFLALHSGTPISGHYAYTCPQCLRTGVHAADPDVTAMLLAAGVRPVEVGAAPIRHPEAPPPGPGFTHDDVLGLHLLLDTDTWFDELLSLS
jgi:hypothetical protein